MTPRHRLLGSSALALACLLQGGCAPSTAAAARTCAATEQTPVNPAPDALLGEWLLRSEKDGDRQLSLEHDTFEFRGGLTTYRGQWRVVAHDDDQYEIELCAATRSELGDHPTERVDKGGVSTPTVQHSETPLEPPLVWGYRITISDGQITSTNTVSDETATWLDNRPVLD